MSAWVRAVAAYQLLQYADQVNRSAQASAELAKRMQQVGNFTKLQRARQQAFYADSAAQLASAQHAVTTTREELVRLLGLTGSMTFELQVWNLSRLQDRDGLLSDLYRSVVGALSHADIALA